METYEPGRESMYRGWRQIGIGTRQMGWVDRGRRQIGRENREWRQIGIGRIESGD